MTRCFLLRGVAALALAAVTLPVLASTDGPPGNWALNEFGGTAAERQMLYDGTPGVLMGTTPASLLFVGWRHGQRVATEAGEALAVPCCAGSPGGGIGRRHAVAGCARNLAGCGAP